MNNMLHGLGTGLIIAAIVSVFVLTFIALESDSLKENMGIKISLFVLIVFFFISGSIFISL